MRKTRRFLEKCEILQYIIYRKGHFGKKRTGKVDFSLKIKGEKEKNVENEKKIKNFKKS